MNPRPAPTPFSPQQEIAPTLGLKLTPLANQKERNKMQPDVYTIKYDVSLSAPYKGITSQHGSRYEVSKINMIKAVRKIFSCGLKEAKEMCEGNPVEIDITFDYANSTESIYYMNGKLIHVVNRALLNEGINMDRVFVRVEYKGTDVTPTGTFIVD